MAKLWAKIKWAIFIDIQRRKNSAESAIEVQTQLHTVPCSAAEVQELTPAEQCVSMLWFRQRSSHNVSSGSSQSAFQSYRDQLQSDTETTHGVGYIIHCTELQLVLTLPYLTFGAGAQGTPALRPQFGPNAQPRQTSWSKKSPRGFCKPQQNCPVGTVKSVQWKHVITEDRSLGQHCGTAQSN